MDSSGNPALAALDATAIDASVKGYPPTAEPTKLGEIGKRGWSLLKQDLPFPVAVLKTAALDHNSRWMARFRHEQGVDLCPHGKTTMSPHLFQRQLAAGFSIFRSSSDYTSTYYQQVSTGAEVHLRKRLFELVDGQVSYTYQVVNISNVDPSVAYIIPSGTTRISSVGFQLVRDTRDKIISTTSGNRIELDTTVAGGPFGAGTDFYKLEFRGAQFYPVFDLQNQVLSVIGRAGTTQSYGQTAAVPYYELFYLGGPNTLRGFQYNDVSPRNTLGYLLGGKSYGFFSLEYSMDVVSPIRVAAFYDAGFVNTPTFDFNPADLHDDVGIGIQLFVAGSPLRLDYAIPLTGNSAAKKGGQFNFSFGTRF